MLNVFRFLQLGTIPPASSLSPPTQPRPASSSPLRLPASDSVVSGSSDHSITTFSTLSYNTHNLSATSSSDTSAASTAMPSLPSSAEIQHCIDSVYTCVVHRCAETDTLQMSVTDGKRIYAGCTLLSPILSRTRVELLVSAISTIDLFDAVRTSTYPVRMVPYVESHRSTKEHNVEFKGGPSSNSWVSRLVLESARYKPVYVFSMFHASKSASNEAVRLLLFSIELKPVRSEPSALFGIRMTLHATCEELGEQRRTALSLKEAADRAERADAALETLKGDWDRKIAILVEAYAVVLNEKKRELRLAKEKLRNITDATTQNTAAEFRGPPAKRPRHTNPGSGGESQPTETEAETDKTTGGQHEHGVELQEEEADDQNDAGSPLQHESS
ncbi:putative mitochondrial protein [Andalucia godoyi]|uniref:Putative mitochondrial protein n=1 Tax=Andalucia godoyi TaxID=505711 RepID=A0A8K0AGT9_ANDGO|nr:putative mitochondrial protein [Andalucia godoyi]|eukprot:ANDGO_08149.mRNA.1 putative mitochondrial protein